MEVVNVSNYIDFYKLYVKHLRIMYNACNIDKLGASISALHITCSCAYILWNSAPDTWRCIHKNTMPMHVIAHLGQREDCGGRYYILKLCKSRYCDYKNVKYSWKCNTCSWIINIFCYHNIMISIWIFIIQTMLRKLENDHICFYMLWKLE